MKCFLFFLIICILPLTSQAQVYLCDGVWSSHPCDEDSKPVENLPPISNADLGRELPVVVPDKKLETIPGHKERQFECFEVASGARLSLRELEVEGSSVRGIIINDSVNPTITPVSIGVTAAGVEEELLLQVSQAISGYQRSAFSVSLSPALERAKSLQIVLYYSPATRCAVERIKVPHRTASSTGGSLLQSEKAIWQQIKNDLDDVNKRITAFRRKRSIEVDFRNKAFLTDYSRLDQAYLRLCSVNQQRAVGNYLSRHTTACTRTKDLLRELYIRAQ